jgi:hypothetical protein
MSADRIDTALDELMWQAVQLDVMAMREIRATWDTEDPDARHMAWATVRDALKRSGRETRMDETRARVTRWQYDVPVLRGAYHMLGLPKLEPGLQAAKQGAAPGILDAAAVAIVGEFLSEDERDILDGPFRGRESR